MAQEFDFDIGNVVGPPGNTGNGIKSIELLSTSGLNKTYRLTMTDDTTFDFTVTDGNGITNASLDSTTYQLTLTFSNGTSYTTPPIRGAQGDDGVSPAVTVTTITGGHRVTITDKDHPQGQSFDVLDGQDRGGDVNDVRVNNTSVLVDGIANVPAASANTYGVVKTGEFYGTKIVSGKLTINAASPGDIKEGETNYRPIAPLFADYAAFYGLARAAGDTSQALSLNTVGNYTDNAKTAIKNMLGVDAGGIAYDSTETYQSGTVGAELQNQTRQLSDVEENQIPELKNAISQKQEAPSTAGTPGQVLSLDSQLNPVWADQTGGGGGGGGMNIVNLSGTQITQVGADNTFYVCGELTELTFTAPAVGITMIRFTSGTTPTVLTVNGVTSWMFDNDPTTASLEANKTYDINVLNGVGVVGWA